MNYNTAFCLVCRVRIVQIGAYDGLPLAGLTLVDKSTGPHRGAGFGSKGFGLTVSRQLGYTSTPLMSDPSKTMVKS